MPTPIEKTISRTTKEGVFHESIRKFPERLVVISEGDSWFSYPLNANLADFIEMMAPLTMFRLEKSGDEARQILNPRGSQYRKLGRYLKRYRKNLNLLIFSGGGNDILDENLPPLLNKKKPGMTWRECVNDQKLAERLAEVRGAYERLLALRDERAPQVEIVAHGYDYLVPSGRKAQVAFGLVKVGPWILPVLKRAGIKDHSDAAAIVRHLVDEFWRVMSPLTTPASKFHLVDSRGTLTPDKRNWNDEIHPTHRGFQEISEKWRPVLCGLFPGKGF